LVLTLNHFLTKQPNSMKKIIMTAALAIAAIGSVSAASNTSVNTMQIGVPQILSVVAVPSYQYMALSDGDLVGTRELGSMQYTIRSNARYYVTTEYASTASFTNSPSPAEQVSSLANFDNHMQFARSVDQNGNPDGTFYTLALLKTLDPFTEPTGAPAVTYPATSHAGTGYAYNAKVVNLGMTSAPGTYTATLTVTVTQP
jgi:hypothetical protein